MYAVGMYINRPIRNEILKEFINISYVTLLIKKGERKQCLLVNLIIFHELKTLVRKWQVNFINILMLKYSLL